MVCWCIRYGKLRALVSSLISSVLVKCFMCNLVYGLSMCTGR